MLLAVNFCDNKLWIYRHFKYLLHCLVIMDKLLYFLNLVPQRQSTEMYLLGLVFSALGIFFIFLTIIVFLLRQKPILIFGKYPSKGGLYFLKYRLALIALKYLRHKIVRDNGPRNLEQFDKPQELNSNPQSYDIVSFMGANEQGEKIMVTLERRRRGVVKACLYLWLPEEGLHCSPNLPDMLYFTTDGHRENLEFRGAGFYIYPEESLRTWRIIYDGELLQVSTDKILPTKLELKFTSNAVYFDYNRDLSTALIADAVAREAWNDSFYGMLKCVDQILMRRTHYAQNGSLEGFININKNELNLKFKAFRDHGFGTERSLSTINRYVYVAIFLDDGTNMVIGNLSQPSFFLSSLKVGYICLKNGEYKSITGCNFELYSYGEKGSPPKNINFIVKTEDTEYFVQTEEQDLALRFVGGEWHSKVFNQFIRCTVNGIKGHGLTEYLYRHDGGRPESISSNDPAWYQNIRQFERTLSSGDSDDKDAEVFIF